MTQQTLPYPTTTRRPVTSVLDILFRRTGSATPSTRFSRGPQVAKDRDRRREPGTHPSLTGHEFAILMTMRPR